MRVAVTGATGLIGSTGIPLRRSGGDAARRAQPAIDAAAAAQGPGKRSGQPADPADIARATRYCAAAAPRCGCSRHRGRRRGRRTGTGIAAARAPEPVSAKTLDTPRRKAIMSDLPGSTTLAVGAGQGLGRGQVFGFLRPNGRVTPPRCAPSSVSRRWRAAVRAGTASHRPAGAPPDRPVSGHAGVPGRSVRLWMVAGAAGQLVRSAGIGSAASEQRGLRCGRTGLDVYMVPGGTWWGCASAGGCA